MATKQQAMDYMISKHDFSQIDDSLLRGLFEVSDGRSQVVTAWFGERFVSFSSPFASTNDVTAKQALDAASETLLGIQIIDDHYCVYHLAPLADLDESEILDAISLTAISGDNLERSLVGGDDL